MSKVRKDSQTNGNQPKEKYRITNWSVYNQALVNRGNITIYFSQEAIEGWRDDGPVQRGGQYIYSDLCIETLPDQVEAQVDDACLDGAYDTEGCWDKLIARGIRPVIPPRRDAVEWFVKQEGDLADYPRNQAIRDMEELGRKGWKVKTDTTDEVYPKRPCSVSRRFTEERFTQERCKPSKQKPK